MKRALLLAVLLLAACESSWVKPGATDADFDKANDTCTKKAEAAYPPILRTVTVPGYSTPNKGACFGSPDLADCLNSQNVLVPPSVQAVDDNAKPRAQAFEDCLRNNGWTKISND